MPCEGVSLKWGIRLKMKVSEDSQRSQSSEDPLNRGHVIRALVYSPPGHLLFDRLQLLLVIGHYAFVRMASGH